MDEIYCLKFVIACCEQSIKEVLEVKENTFSFELFEILLKKNVYETLSGEEWIDNVNEMIENMNINYDFIDQLENNEDLEQKIELDFDKIKDMSEEERTQLAESIDLTEMMDNEVVEVEIEIPISSIINELKRMMENGEIELDYNPRTILRDVNIMEEIWENWMPYDDFMIQSKSMVEYIISTL